MQSPRGGNMKFVTQEAARDTGLSEEKIEVRIFFLHILELSMALPGSSTPPKHCTPSSCQEISQKEDPT